MPRTIEVSRDAFHIENAEQVNNNTKLFNFIFDTQEECKKFAKLLHKHPKISSKSGDLVHKKIRPWNVGTSRYYISITKSDLELLNNYVTASILPENLQKQINDDDLKELKQFNDKLLQQLKVLSRTKSSFEHLFKELNGSTASAAASANSPAKPTGQSAAGGSPASATTGAVIGSGGGSAAGNNESKLSKEQELLQGWFNKGHIEKTTDGKYIIQIPGLNPKPVNSRDVPFMNSLFSSRQQQQQQQQQQLQAQQQWQQQHSQKLLGKQQQQHMDKRAGSAKQEDEVELVVKELSKLQHENSILRKMLGINRNADVSSLDSLSSNDLRHILEKINQNLEDRIQQKSSQEAAKAERARQEAQKAAQEAEKAAQKAQKLSLTLQTQEAREEAAKAAAAAAKAAAKAEAEAEALRPASQNISRRQIGYNQSRQRPTSSYQVFGGGGDTGSYLSDGYGDGDDYDQNENRGAAASSKSSQPRGERQNGSNSRVSTQKHHSSRTNSQQPTFVYAADNGGGGEQPRSSILSSVGHDLDKSEEISNRSSGSGSGSESEHSSHTAKIESDRQKAQNVFELL
jgi:hypothetical protein